MCIGFESNKRLNNCLLTVVQALFAFLVTSRRWSDCSQNSWSGALRESLRPALWIGNSLSGEPSWAKHGPLIFRLPILGRRCLPLSMELEYRQGC